MKNLLVLLLLTISSVCFSQNTLNFEEIKRNVTDSTSSFYYERLLYKFAYMPAAMDSLEAKHLYYGKLAANKKKPSEKSYSGNFFPLVREKKYKDAIAEGEAILKDDPVNLEVLGLLVQSYTLADRENRMLPVRGLQFKRLVDTIFENATGNDRNKTYTVMAVADEYVISGIQNINLFQYRRKTQKFSHGMTDHWRNGKKRISFNVVYDY